MKIHEMLLSHLGIGHSMPSMEKASFEVALKGKKQIAEGTMEFIFEKPKNFHFNAGQHVRMTLINPPETDSKGNSRFLTLANTPQDKELVVAIRMTDSAFKRVLGKMQIGEKVLIQILLHSPHGSFVIHDDSSKPAVFLIGGIGIVPAFSMIKDAIERKLPHKIFLFYSNRKPEDTPYLKELQDLAKHNPNFKLIATMTQMEKSKRPWQEETGFIDRPMLERYLDDLHTPIYYIAGLTEMVNAMKKLVKDIGVKEENVRSEDFSGVKMALINLKSDAKLNKNHFILGGVGLISLLGVILHIGASVPIYLLHIDGLFALFGKFAIAILIVVIILKVILIFKFKHFLGLKHGKRKV